MIIGNGLLAQTFVHFRDDSDILIFASGISNSSEAGPKAFDREFNLLKDFSALEQQFIYFSTVSIHDPDLISSPYIIHKKRLESYITQTFNKYLIFRLPIVVSGSDNPFTLTNFIHHKLVNGETVPIYKNASRYLIDISDVRSVVTEMIHSNQFCNEVININFNNPILMEDLIQIFETVLEKKSVKQLINRGAKYTTDNAKFIEFINHANLTIQTGDVFDLIKKYYGG